jgi:8-oxo-dGTP pyrophosphatase MutT (NUDIX family)
VSTGRRGRKNAGRATAGKGGRGKARHETSAGGVVFRVADAQPLFLLIRDSYGHWGFPKGHLERGERADTAALREVMEETGLRAVTVLGSVATIEWFFRFRGALIHKKCEFFLMEAATDVTKPQHSEGITACRWTSAGEAEELIGYENARSVLRRAREMLAARAQKVGAIPPPAATASG